jgi:hypothetical protein
MPSVTLTNRINATIECPLKKSTIVWSKCEGYRLDFGCLCKEARDRLKIKCQGVEALQAQMQRIKIPVPDSPDGWRVEKKTRFYLIYNDQEEVVHRATNQKEADQYLGLCAKLVSLEQETEKLWALLRDEVILDPEVEVAEAVASSPAESSRDGDGDGEDEGDPEDDDALASTLLW